MLFGPTPLGEAEGAILAHSVKQGRIAFKKGRILSADDLKRLAEAGVAEVIAARLEDGDVHEDEAATQLAEAALGPGSSLTAAFTGRCNLVADDAGLLIVDRETLDAVNAVDEAVTIASLPPYEPVTPRQLLATVKIIPFAVRQDSLTRCLEILTAARPLVRVAPFAEMRAALIQTTLPGLKPSILDKTREAAAARLESLGCTLTGESRVPHETGAVGQAVEAAVAQGTDMVLISGASAIVDRRDIVPAGIEAAGGTIDHFGMPVDPGNLLLLARKEATPILGLPGCARSPKLNGFDWVLQRLIAGLAVTREDIMQMGAGGLLKEIGGRPLPRDEAVAAATLPRAPRIGAVVLAAGQSRRMGETNKLLLEIEGKPMLRWAVEAILGSQAGPCVVVTGHDREAVEAAVAGAAVEPVHNPDFALGLSTSLLTGLAKLPPELDGALVLLGDMPRVTVKVIDQLIAAFNPLEGRAICIPTWQGERGNPVLLAKRFFDEIGEVTGDIGARQIVKSYPELVAEVPVASDGVLVDVDTPARYEELKSAS